jgi:O-antigen/teichoic acid export membrane protein
MKQSLSIQNNVLRIWRHFMGDSLYRNSIYLLINMGFSAAVGFIFWVLCAHLYAKEQLGYATALLSALALASAFSNIGLNRTILRFLGNSKTQTQDIITKLALISAASLVTGTCFSLFLHAFGIKHATTVTALVFVVAVIMSSVKSIFDNSFVALKSASSTLFENSIANIIKLIFPLFVVSWGFLGIFTAQLVAAAGAVICSIIIMRQRFKHKLRTKPSRRSLDGRWHFMFGSYTTDLVGGLPSSILPIIVVTKLGAAQGALWYSVVLLVNFLLLISSTINQVMFAEISNATEGIAPHIKKALLAMYGLVLPLTLIVVLFAPHILTIFNKSYIEATPILRLMALFALLGVINYVAGSILALYKKVAYLTATNVANAGVVITYTYMFATNLKGIVAGWIWGEIVNLLLFAGGALYYTRQKNMTPNAAKGTIA